MFDIDSERGRCQASPFSFRYNPLRRMSKVGTHTLYEDDGPFRHYYRYVAPYVELSICIPRRDLHTSVLEAVLERPAKHDALALDLCAKLS